MDRFNVAVKVVQNAGELLRQCRLEEAEVSQKTGHQDLVTRWDRRIEQLLRNEILTAFPQDAIVGEEYPPETHRAESVTWYIDPIDGTTNFINQHQNYAISVGCWDGSVPLFGLVLDVERKTLYWGKHGGGAAIFTVDGNELPLNQKSTVLALNAIELKGRILMNEKSPL